MSAGFTTKVSHPKERGRLIEILTELEQEGDIMNLDMSNCFGNVEMKWADKLAEFFSEFKGVKNFMKQILSRQITLKYIVIVYLMNI